MLGNLRDILVGPGPVRWTSELYGTDTEFTLALEDGVPPEELEVAASNAVSKADFRDRVLDAYYGQF